MKNKILIISFLLLMTTISIYSLKGMLTPYVPFKKAILSNERIQIIGNLDKDSPIEYKNNKLSFILKDKSKLSLHVVFKGQKSEYFNQTEKVVAIGKYNNKDKIFYASQILTKCPSKYNKTE